MNPLKFFSFDGISFIKPFENNLILKYVYPRGYFNKIKF